MKFVQSKTTENIGYGTSVSQKYARFLNKDGTHNVTHIGRDFSERTNIYHWLINTDWWKFLIAIFGFYFTINFLFAVLYFLFCVPNLQGLIVGTDFETFEEVYFFSAQTLTTVGYGRISPLGIVTNTIAATEALMGILTLAIITGLLYGRFVKPRAYVKFSHNAIIAPFRKGKALMFRLVPIKNAMLNDVSIKVNVSMMVEESGKMVNKFYQLPLQISKLDNLPMSWTVVHEIDENSPLHEINEDNMEALDLELLIYFYAFDEDFASTVIKRTSYTYNEIVYGAKFQTAFYDSADGRGTFVEHHKLNMYDMVDFE